MAKQKPILVNGHNLLKQMTSEQLISVIEQLAESISNIDDTCNHHALYGEWSIIGKCGCCGEQEWSHNRHTPHRNGCPIEDALQFCRSGFKNKLNSA